MDIAGSLSNPAGPLKVLLERAPTGRKNHCLRSAPSRQARDIGTEHRKAGWVLAAIVRVLTDRQEPMRAKDVHVAVGALLGEPVRWSSVKNALADNVAGSSPRFVRVARGRYTLAKPPSTT